MGRRHDCVHEFYARELLGKQADNAGGSRPGGAALAESDRIARVAKSRCSGGLLVALGVLLILAGVACSGGDAETLPATTTVERSTSAPPASTTRTGEAEAPTSTTRGQSVEDEIIARYTGYWDARFAANSGTPNPDDPALRDYATGAQLDAVVAETQANLDQGLAFRRPENPAGIQRVTVLEVNGDRAVVQECVVSDGVIIHRETGEIVNDEVTTHNVRGELQRVAGAWRVSAAQLVQRWEGVAGCAAS